MPHDHAHSPAVALLLSVMESHRPALLRFARRPGRSSADVDDIVQDALLLAWEQRERFDPTRGRPSSWLTRLTHFAALAHAEELSRRTENEAGLDPPPSFTVPDDTLALAAWRDAIATLPPDDRDLVLRRALDGATWDELADDLGTTRQSLLRRFEALSEALRRALR
ncbi:MAG: sigma-70 family RNA polymerase sigma factor [Polyangiales bacterium]